MLEKLKRSIEEMPRPAYIFLKNILLLSCVLLACSLALFLSPDKGAGAYERTKLAWILLESPAGILLLGVVGLAFILDRS